MLIQIGKSKQNVFKWLKTKHFNSFDFFLPTKTIFQIWQILLNLQKCTVDKKKAIKKVNQLVIRHIAEMIAAICSVNSIGFHSSISPRFIGRHTTCSICFLAPLPSSIPSNGRVVYNYSVFTRRVFFGLGAVCQAGRPSLPQASGPFCLEFCSCAPIHATH